MSTLNEVKAVLCDIGGVLYVGDTPIDGAVEAISYLKRRLPLRFVTNTTQTRGDQVAASLEKLGFDIKPHEIITALDVTKAFLQQQQSSAYFLLCDDARAFFDDLPYERRDYVVVGDAQENFSYDNLNRAFRYLQDGAKLVAAAKNRYFMDTDRALSMDAGGFVQALEYAADCRAEIIGKPSMAFYHLACDALGMDYEACLMIGDDIESDIQGAREAGLQTLLVQTGKFRPVDLNRGIRPDHLLPSIADIASLL